MRKLLYLFILFFTISCSKDESFSIQSFDSTIRQTATSAKGRPNTEIITTINGERYTLNLDRDFFYDEDEDEFVHLQQDYLVEFEVDEQFVTVRVFFDIMTNRDNNTIVDGIPDGNGGLLPTANTMRINVNGEETTVSVLNATVDYPRVRFDDGQYSFDISL